MTNDPIGDFIVRLKNASAVGHDTVTVPFSNVMLAIAEKLKDAGFVAGVERKGKKVRKFIDVTLKYESKKSAVRGVKRLSKPGRRLYRRLQAIVPVHYGHGALILSTPKGIKTDVEARKEKVGGEALFEIW